MKKRYHPHDYKITITKLKEGDQEGYEFYIPAFDAYVYGDTIQEALEGYLIYFDDEAERRKEEKIPMPRPDAGVDIIKQVPLRIPERVYQRISEMAKKEGRSFNSFVTGLLEKVA